jgi:hypothetical protein
MGDPEFSCSVVKEYWTTTVDGKSDRLNQQDFFLSKFPVLNYGTEHWIQKDRVWPLSESRVRHGASGRLEWSMRHTLNSFR